MDWTAIGVLVAIVVGVPTLIGVGIQIRSYFRNHPKRQLEYKVTSRRLVQSTPQAQLEIRVDGIEVPDPYLVEFRLKSNSRADIATSSFDAGLGLKIRVQPGGALVLGAEFTGEIHTNAGSGDGWDWAEFEVRPQLIRKGSTLAFDFIANGEPGVSIDSPLIDVPVVEIPRRSRMSDMVTAATFFGLPTISLVPLVMLTLAPPSSISPGVAFAVLAATLAGATLAATGGVKMVLRIRDDNPRM